MESSEKRVSAVSISNDGLYVCFADKFGVVWVVDIHDLDVNGAFSNRKPAPLLAHYCSIITRLEFSPDGCFIISADRDFKIRVSVFPKKPLEGAHEIQSFCLGHTQFVTSLAFICSKEFPQGLLLSGSGDSTVRLWDITSGSLLDTCEVGKKAGLLESNESEESCSAVTELCAIQDSNLVAVAIQSFRGVILLGCDFSSQTLHFSKVVSITEENFIPTSMGSTAGDLLWFVTGISKLQGSDLKSLARLKVVSGIRKDNPAVVGDDEIPGGQKLLEKLQGSVTIDESVFSTAAEALKSAMCNLLIKKQYSTENREFRKRTRNDRKGRR
ncbi:tRNA (guanine-N(7)-)-methyltransferase non-catalytic subunit wdr4 [Linum perenne]